MTPYSPFTDSATTLRLSESRQRLSYPTWMEPRLIARSKMAWRPLRGKISNSRATHEFKKFSRKFILPPPKRRKPALTLRPPANYQRTQDPSARRRLPPPPQGG